jgi:hypothetical protein
VQLPSQPSPAAMLPSSHCSPGSSTPLPHTVGMHAPLFSTNPTSQAKHVAPGPAHETQPISHGAQMLFEVAVHGETV